jgi:hypothetical protein
MVKGRVVVCTALVLRAEAGRCEGKKCGLVGANAALGSDFRGG